MIYRDAKKAVSKMVKDWNIEHGTDIRIRKQRYFILAGGLMYCDDLERIRQDVYSEMDYTRMMEQASYKPSEP